MKQWQRLIDLAIEEDYGTGDVTSESVIDPWIASCGQILAKQHCMVAGIEVCRQVFERFDQAIEFETIVGDGNWADPMKPIAEVTGTLGNLLAGERIALNFLQRLSGIATYTSLFVDKIKDTNARITDTRKTTPGMRELEKHAVKVAGASNHRFGLFDGVLIKDNHLAVFKEDVGQAVIRARRDAPHTLKIEVEVTDLDGFKQALAAKADIIMLDNMSIETMGQAVELNAGQAILEASGNVNLDNVLEIAQVGVDLISVGAITHSAPAADISFDIKT
jgi:nicotinate-nucleotide pyrophosphorylase (carboxylating)